jgi:cytochrome c oxidase subunit 2
LTGRTARRGRGIWASIVALAVIGVACAKQAPQDSLSPVGPVARQEDNLFRPVFWIAVGVFVLVEGLLVFAVVRYRRRSDRDAPRQVHGNTRLEIFWTILPAALLAGIAVPTVVTIFDVARKPVGANVVNVKVTGHQWWWEYEYTDIKTTDGTPLRSANELVIPVGRWVSLEMTSVDVIHSYWVPKLAGKQDVIPGRITHLKLRSDVPGVFLGQCAEFCALSHANMRLRVIAQQPPDFERWVQTQTQPALPPTDPLAMSRLTNTCFACHAIRGVVGNGGATTGPDLTHFASRTTFAGSMLEMNAANIARWLRDPPGVKPGIPIGKPGGTMMPNYHMSQQEIDALVSYLMSLK